MGGGTPHKAVNLVQGKTGKDSVQWSSRESLVGVQYLSSELALFKDVRGDDLDPYPRGDIHSREHCDGSEVVRSVPLPSLQEPLRPTFPAPASRARASLP